jgi:DNA-binding protein HU-beta
MSKAFLAGVLQDTAGLSGVAANAAAGDVISAIVTELKREGRFTVPGFGTFTVAKRKARTARNPRTGETIKVKASKTVRFKASPTLRGLV